MKRPNTCAEMFCCVSSLLTEVVAGLQSRAKPVIEEAAIPAIL